MASQEAAFRIMDENRITKPAPIETARAVSYRAAIMRDSMLTDAEWDAVFDAIIEHEPTRGPHHGSFTPFAFEHLLADTGRPIHPGKMREWAFGGDTEGRIRLRTSATLGVAFQFFIATPSVTHMWCRFTDKRWHLVHQKGC